MRSTISIAILCGLTALVGCESMNSKSSRVSTGDSQDMVLSVMGPPAHREIN